MIDFIYADSSGALRTVSVIELPHNHDSAATPTDHPIDKGSDVTDHIKVELDSFHARCFVGNTMLRAEATNMNGVADSTTSVQFPGGGAATLHSFTGEVDRVKLVYEELRGIQRSSKTCTIVTPLRRYESMCLTRLSFPVEAKDGIQFDVEAREIIIVETQSVSTPVPRQTRGHARATTGNASTTTAPAQAPANPPTRSGAAGLADAVGSFFGG